MHKRAHDSTGHPLEEGIIDPYNLTSGPIRTVTRPASSPSSHPESSPIRPIKAPRSGAPPSQRLRRQKEIKGLGSSPSEVGQGEMARMTVSSSECSCLCIGAKAFQSPAVIKAYQPRARVSQESASGHDPTAGPESASVHTSPAPEHEGPAPSMSAVQSSSPMTPRPTHSSAPTGSSSQPGTPSHPSAAERDHHLGPTLHMQSTGLRHSLLGPQANLLPARRHRSLLSRQHHHLHGTRRKGKDRPMTPKPLSLPCRRSNPRIPAFGRRRDASPFRLRSPPTHAHGSLTKRSSIMPAAASSILSR